MTTMTRRERERQAREGEIVAAAEALFSQKGFDATSMDEIAAAAQFTKRTLYQYFQNKEELYYAAALPCFTQLRACIAQAAEAGATGMQRLRLGGAGYYRFFRDHPQMLRLMGELGQVKKRFAGGGARLDALLAADNALFTWMAQAVEQGKADGSIRADVDSMQTTFSVIFLLTGFFNQLAATGETFMAHFGLEAETFCSKSLDLVFGAIEA